MQSLYALLPRLLGRISDLVEKEIELLCTPVDDAEFGTALVDCMLLSLQQCAIVWPLKEDKAKKNAQAQYKPDTDDTDQFMKLIGIQT